MSAPKDIKILVADDFSMMRKIVINILAELGYKNVLEAANGEEAFEVLTSQGDVGFLITDWHMPKMNGLELLHKVRSNPSLSKLPVLMITAEALQENIVAAIKAGVNNFIVKPFDVQIMEEKIKKIFG